MERRVAPGESEGIRARDGVGSSALTHAVQFEQRDIQAEEELEGIFGGGGSSSVAFGTAVQAKSFAHLFKH